MKLGDLYPHLRTTPGYEGVAERDVPRDGPAPSGPGPVAMAASFLGAMRRLVADGGRLAPREVRAARRLACLACPHHDPGPDACKTCGCGSVIPGGLKAKRAIASSSCPDDPPRWPPV